MYIKHFNGTILLILNTIFKIIFEYIFIIYVCIYIYQ